MIYGSVTEDFDNLLHVKRCKTCVSGLNALIGGTKVVNNPYYSIGPKMMFGSVTGHFANLRYVNNAKLVLQVWMHNFEAPKLRSIHSTPLDPKWYMGVLRSSSLIFYTQKDENFSFRPECTIWGTKVPTHPFYSIRPKILFGSVSEHVAKLRHVIRWKLTFRSWMHYFGVPKLRSIHSTPLDPKWCLGVLQSISLTFST
jgi:hypothetical protein